MKMIIDGKKVDSLSGETFDVINPATGKVIESVPKATAEDIELAVTAAVKGQKEWAKTSVTQRADILHRFVEIVEQNKVFWIHRIAESCRLVRDSIPNEGLSSERCALKFPVMPDPVSATGFSRYREAYQASGLVR